MALLYKFCVGDDIESVRSSSDDEQRTAARDWRLLLPKLHLGLRRPESMFIVARLSCLFALDAFAGGFVMQTWIAYWFEQRWNFEPNLLGDLISVSNVVAGISGISAAYFVNKFGAINTMVWSHLPSNILLLLVPFMPSRRTAAFMLIARFCISQMDVPARQTYVAIVVLSDERSAAGGITNIARSIGLLLAPTFTGYLSQATPVSFQFNSPWVISGVLKCIYDLTLWSLYHFSSGLKDAEQKNAQAAKAAAQFKDSSHKSSSEVTPLIVAK
jgi:MFS family permease